MQVVNRREQCCAAPCGIVVNNIVVQVCSGTALFRAEEPTGVNNAVLTVHISSMIVFLLLSDLHLVQDQIVNSRDKSLVSEEPERETDMLVSSE